MNNKKEFQKLYDTHTLQELAEKFGVSVRTIINKAKKAGLKMKGKGNSRAAGRPKKDILGF